MDPVVTRATQSLLLALTGVVLIRMSAGDTYLSYVNEWMKWPLVTCGAMLLLLGVLDLGTPHDAGAPGIEPGSHVPRAAWLLFAPSLVFFLIAPPALGADFAARAQTASVPVGDDTEGDLPPLPGPDPVPVLLDDVMMRAYLDDGATLADRRLELTGFVSHDSSGWYVTRYAMSCCAADVSVMRVGVIGADAPADDQWVRVVGTHVAGTGDEGTTVPEITAEAVELIEAPRNQYQ
jgi:uncharacterized repeat protein (TIGR03943 family)